MIEQPTQPLKFFASLLEVERDWEKRAAGNPGRNVITEDILFIPPFQIKFDNRNEDIDDFQDGVIELINHNDGVTLDITESIRAMGVFTYDDYQNFVVYHYPLIYLNIPGDYYLKISDGTPDSEFSHEIWYSEVFRLCDLNRNLVRNVTFVGWNSSQGVNVLATTDRYAILVCESTGNGAYFDAGDFYVIENEPLDFYCFGQTVDLQCGDARFLPLHFALVDSVGEIISNQIDGVEGAIKGRFVPTQSRPASLRGWVDAGETGQSAWELLLFHANPQIHDGIYSGSLTDENENIGKSKVLRWSNDKNVCDIIYETESGYVTISGVLYYWEMSYENYLILDDPPLIPDFEIKENVAENDKGDKFLLLGAQQEWYYLQIAGSENLAKAIQFIHLMSTVEIDYDGESHVICENTTEISQGDDNNFTIRFRFRQESCPVQSCGFDIECCPNLENVLDYESGGTGALPACDGGSAGDRYLVRVTPPGKIWVYECIDGSWTLQGDENVKGACVFNEGDDPDTDCVYWYYRVTDTSYYRFVDISTVTDMTTGVARINISNYGKKGLVVIAQVDGVDSGGYKILTGDASDILYVYCGAGTFDFSLRIVDENCNYGHSDIVNQTITDV